MPTVTGFRHAPVSKGLIFATAGASILAQAAKASRRAPVLGVLSHALVFSSPAELLFGTLVMYYMRLLERESGSSKFGAFAAVSTGIAAALQWAAGRSGLRLPPPPSGPYGFLFACFVQYFFQVPASNKMVVWQTWRVSDKVFLYLVGLQLLLSGGVASLAAGGAGLVAGLLYRANVAGIKRFRFPAFVNRSFASTVGVLLGNDSPSPAAAAAAPGGRQDVAGQQRRGPGGSAARAGAPAGRPRAATGGGGGGSPASALDLPPPSVEAVEQLLAMGFGGAEAERALQLANNDVQAAIGLLLSN